MLHKSAYKGRGSLDLMLIFLVELMISSLSVAIKLIIIIAEFDNQCLQQRIHKDKLVSL